MDALPPQLGHRTKPTHRLPDWTDTRALTLLVIAAVALALFWWWSGRAAQGVAVAGPEPPSQAEKTAASSPEPRAGSAIAVTGPTPQTEQSPDQAPTAQALAPSTGSEVMIDVRGGVRNRGVQVLPAGSRVIDAVEAAGGLRPGRSYGEINLAEILSDGQQIVVGRRPAAGQNRQSVPDRGEGSKSVSPTGAGDLVSLNAATPEQLESLPGVGPVLAERIVAWREEHGRFSATEDLLDVSGIGDKVLAGLRDGVSL